MIDTQLAGAETPIRGSDQTPEVVPAPPKRWQRYGPAIACVVATVLAFAVEPILGSSSLLIIALLFTFATASAASVGSFGAGLAVLLLGAAWFLLVSRRSSPAVTDSVTFISLALYLLSAGGVALLVTIQRRLAETGFRTARNGRAQLERELAAARQREEAERGKEERYRTPEDEVKDSAMFMLTPEGRPATWNQGVGRLLGYEKIEFLRTSPADLFTPDDQAQGLPQKELADAVEQGRVRAERWLVRKDGSWLPVSVSVTSVRDQSGRLVGFAKRLRDLSEVRRIEEELRRHKEALELGYEAAGLGSWDHDLVTGELRLDQRARAMLGFRLEDPVTYGKWLEALHPDDIGTSEELREAAIRERHRFSTQFRVVRPDGTTHWIAAIGRGSYDPTTGRPLRMRGILLDTTERKQTEERLQEVLRLEAIGRLAGGIAHDLNNMLVAILGFSDLLARSLGPQDPRRDDVEQISRAATQSATLTRQLLAFARRELIQPRRLDLNGIVGYAVGMLRPVLGENIDLIVQLSPVLGGIHADPARVEQILMNLVLNARDAMPRGGRVEVETAAVELEATPSEWQPEAEAPPPGRYAVLSVRDTGHGIDSGTLQHIWEPFFTTKPAGQGTGLGLSVVYGSVKQSGGFVWVESEVGRGTRVRVYWPEITVSADQLDETPAVPPVRGGSETLLVVEDEAAVRALMRRTVTSIGYRCLEARDAMDALHILEREHGHIDLVITDVVMPGMSGGHLGELLGQQHPGIPVLYTSGFANDDVIRRGLLDASRPFLQKPFAPDDLARKIREVLDTQAVAPAQQQTA